MNLVRLCEDLSAEVALEERNRQKRKRDGRGASPGSRISSSSSLQHDRKVLRLASQELETAAASRIPSPSDHSPVSGRVSPALSESRIPASETKVIDSTSRVTSTSSLPEDRAILRTVSVSLQAQMPSIPPSTTPPFSPSSSALELPAPDSPNPSLFSMESEPVSPFTSPVIITPSLPLVPLPESRPLYPGFLRKADYKPQSLLQQRFESSLEKDSRGSMEEQ